MLGTPAGIATAPIVQPAACEAGGGGPGRVGHGIGRTPAAPGTCRWVEKNSVRSVISGTGMVGGRDGVTTTNRSSPLLVRETLAPDVARRKHGYGIRSAAILE